MGIEQSAGRLYVLDLLRFAAAMAIVGYHFIPTHPEVWSGDSSAFEVVADPLQYAWLGVEAFFVISGFVICMSSWGRSLSRFFVSRVSRLMPAYMCAVLLTAAAVSLEPLARERPQPSHVLINLTMLQQFLNVPPVDSVYWTLFVELKFYLLFAIVVYFGVTYRRVVLFCLVWTVVALFAMYTGSGFLRAVVEPSYAPLFVAGITLYLIHRFGPDLLLWGMLAASVAISMVCLAQRDAVRQGAASYPASVAVMLAFFAVMVAVALGGFSWLRWRGMVTVGALTYPVYLLHHEIGLRAIARLAGRMPPWVLLAAVVAGVLLASHAVHRLVERPLARALRDGLSASFARIRSADAAVRTVPAPSGLSGRNGPPGRGAAQPPALPGRR
ncbi:acyltransferase family protein [Phytohabitans houttuyneae]|uniref:Acyltransferase n=1 Tax=Phytohabitans houttuyneae TaxID=1076126 RepID=A0A6V8KLQ4_9ACTN|nr:acyltransferase [Phytohabitans houttuyneae]GFJ83341.1 acyltransferase [Phytohabitans houttuyneae]